MRQRPPPPTDRRRAPRPAPPLPLQSQARLQVGSLLQAPTDDDLQFDADGMPVDVPDEVAPPPRARRAVGGDVEAENQQLRRRLQAVETVGAASLVLLAPGGARLAFLNAANQPCVVCLLAPWNTIRDTSVYGQHQHSQPHLELILICYICRQQRTRWAS